MPGADDRCDLSDAEWNDVMRGLEPSESTAEFQARQQAMAEEKAKLVALLQAERRALASSPASSTDVAGLVKLIELRANTTPGEWDVDSLKNDGDYGSGPNPSSGFNSFAMYAVDAQSGKSVALFDTLNSDAIEVEEDTCADEYGDVAAWDRIGKANLEFVAALVNWFDANIDRLNQPSPPPTGSERLQHEFAIERAVGQQQIERLETALRRIGELSSTRRPGGMRAIRAVVLDAIERQPTGSEQ